MNDKLSGHNQARGAQRQQIGIARTGADQPDFAQRGIYPKKM
jgi:ABC-type methionine transport system ATPase subunit